MLRAVHDHEVPDLRRWRNHPRVRASSLTTHVIAETEHTRWWAGVCRDPARQVLIYVHEGAAAGVVTFSGLTPGSLSAEWGFYLDLDGLERTGALLPAWIGLERSAIDHAFGPLGLSTLRGEVLARNEPARGLHRRFGFTEVAVYPREVGGVRRDVIAVQLNREDYS
ncbi:GNAT family N-acetyltransferase [Nonomuraea rhizosphaerae]|uniref:GNAT family N-acetyltransferase n=1 Tax=Nonomuraea rhizosphaerae TaxID=2665663 RepID=UPI001C602020|nr:GNAT family N-acetyltransferase [Nonomuraea rhizosphaerae]